METNSKPMYQPWNEDAFQADVFVRGMTWLQRLLYRSLLQAMFFHNTRPYLPTDDDVLWVLAGAESPEMWEQNKAKILKRFNVCEHDANLLEQKRVTADWQTLINARTKMAELGQKSAAIRKELYGSAQPRRNNVLTSAEQAPNVCSNGGGTGPEQDIDIDIVSKSEVKERESKEKACNAFVESCNQADWKNLAIRHKHIFGSKASVSFKDKYFDACHTYGESIVLECFDTWAPGAKDWAQNNNVRSPLFAFFKKLPEEANDAVEINCAEKEITEKAESEKKKSDEIQAESIERQTQEIVALMESRDVKRESEGSVEDFLASVEENG